MTDDPIGHKVRLNKLKRTVFSDPSKIKLEINSRKIPGNP